MSALSRERGLVDEHHFEGAPERDIQTDIAERVSAVIQARTPDFSPNAIIAIAFIRRRTRAEMAITSIAEVDLGAAMRAPMTL
jgi:hypothetical protein